MEGASVAPAPDAARGAEPAQQQKKWKPSKKHRGPQRRRSSVEPVDLSKYSYLPELRAKCWALFDDPDSSCFAYYLSLLILILIFVSTINFTIDTVPSIHADIGDGLFVLEATCIYIFTVEVCARIFSTPNQRNFWTDFFNWIDILAILPFYIEAIAQAASDGDSSTIGNLGIIRVLRLVRIARIFKASRYSSSIRVFTLALAGSMRPLSMLVFLVGIAMVIFSSAVYYAEFTDDGCRAGEWRRIFSDGLAMGETQGETDGLTLCEDVGTIVSGGTLEASTFMLTDDATATHGIGSWSCFCSDVNVFTSIPSTCWWCLVTMTTVGYGDFYPVTTAGRLVAVFTMISGIIILALPITVIGTNFSRVLRQVQTEKLIDELDGANRNEDGSVQRAEIEAIIAHIHGASAEHGLTVHLPVDAAELLAKYDADGSGRLEQRELDALKRDILLQSLTGDKKAAPHAEAAKRRHHEEVIRAADNAAGDAGAAAAAAAAVAQLHAAGPPTSSAAHGRNTISGAFSAIGAAGDAASTASGAAAVASPASLAFATEVNNALAQIEGNVNAKLTAIEGLLQRLAQRPAPAAAAAAAAGAAAGAISFDGTDQEHSAASAIQARVRGAQTRKGAQGEQQQQQQQQPRPDEKPKEPIVDEDRDPDDIVVDRYGGDMYERLANEATLYGNAAKAEAAEAAAAAAAPAAAAPAAGAGGAAGGGAGGGGGEAAAPPAAGAGGGASPAASQDGGAAMIAPQDADNAPEGRGTVVASRYDDHNMPRGSFYDPNKRDYYQSAGGGIES